MNEPAFPSQELDGSGSPRMALSPGMTMRDYFAAKALVGMLSADAKIPDDGEIQCSQEGHRKVLAKTAYGLADAMLAERAKGTQ